MEEFDDISDKEIKDLMDILESMSDEETDDVDYDLIMKTFGLDVPELEKEMDNYVPQLDLGYRKSNPDAITPSYAYQSDSGMDLCSTEDIWIFEFDRKLIPTGIHLDIPEGHEIQIRSKSGLALKQGLMVLNSPGTVDQNYTGEIQVILFNTTKDRIKIQKGQKVAQAVLCPVVAGKWVNLIEKEELTPKDRGDNGFGSTNLF